MNSILALFGRERPSRACIEGDGSIVTPLQVVIPVTRNWPALAFLLLWVCGWAFGWVAVVSVLFTGHDFHGKPAEVQPAFPLGVRGFLLIWLTGWTVGGWIALLQALWQVFGREVVILDRHALIAERRIKNRRVGGWRIPLWQIEFVRASAAPEENGWRGFVAKMTRRGASPNQGLMGDVKGDVSVFAREGDRTFGIALNRAEAQKLAQLFNDRLARLADDERVNTVDR